jgi:hypothetical protein
MDSVPEVFRRKEPQFVAINSLIDTNFLPWKTMVGDSNKSKAIAAELGIMLVLLPVYEIDLILSLDPLGLNTIEYG